MSDSRTGKTHTPETRAKMSDSHTGITPTNAMTVNVNSLALITN
jgi:hypothetical protein